MSHSNQFVFRGRAVAVALTLATILAILPGAARAQKAAAAPAKDKTVTRDQARFKTAVGTVVNQGFDAHLPPHLSVLLGVSKTEQEVPVKQRTLPSDKSVRGFDVAADNHNNVVIFVENPEERVFYLASAKGSLRKVVSIKDGVGQERRIEPKVTRAFQVERQVWLDILVPENPFKTQGQQ